MGDLSKILRRITMPWDTSSPTPQSGPCTALVYPSGQSIPGTGCTKPRIPVHVFKQSVIHRFQVKIRILMTGKCMLIDAFGRQKSGCPGVLYGHYEQNPVLEVRDFSQNTQGKIRFTLRTSPSDTSHLKGFPTPKNGTNSRKTTPLFWECSIPFPIRLSGAESTLKMTANSTYREADRVKDGLEEGEMKGRGVLGG